MAIANTGKAERIEVRATAAQRQLIQRGAEASEKSVTEFMLQSACQAAEMAILDQRIFFVDDETFKRFEERLNEPAQASAGLKKLLERKAPWD